MEVREVVREKKSEVMRVEDYERLAREYLSLVGQRVSPQQALQFLQICKAFGLNPFKREIYLVPYGRDGANIIVGYEVYLKRAERSGKLSGWRVWIEKDEDGEIKACIMIKRKDWEEPFIHEVYLKEYKRDTQIWREKPLTMLKKVAIAQGFRLAFPVELGGLPYTGDEVESEGEIIDMETGEVVEVRREDLGAEEEEKIKNFVSKKLKEVVFQERGHKKEEVTGGEESEERPVEGEGEKLEEKALERPEVKGEEVKKWTIEAIREVASEELKRVVREYRVSARELIELFERFQGDESKIIEEIKKVKGGDTR